MPRITTVRQLIDDVAAQGDGDELILVYSLCISMDALKYAAEQYGMDTSNPDRLRRVMEWLKYNVTYEEIDARGLEAYIPKAFKSVIEDEKKAIDKEALF